MSSLNHIVHVTYLGVRRTPDIKIAKIGRSHVKELEEDLCREADIEPGEPEMSFFLETREGHIYVCFTDTKCIIGF